MHKLPGRNDPCFCGSGLKYKKCCGNKFPIHPDSLIGRLIRLYRFLDNLATEVLKSGRLPCKAGCSQCCQGIMFGVSTIEFDFIKYGLLNFPREQLRRIEERVTLIGNDIMKKVPEVFKDPASFMPSSVNAIEYEMLAMYRENVFFEAGKICCPFLENDICLIYNYRPFVCRFLGPFKHPSGDIPCSMIKEENLSDQKTLPKELTIVSALGFAFLGKPLLVWLYNEIKENTLLSFTEQQIKSVFTYPASMITIRGRSIPPSSLDKFQDPCHFQ